MAAEDPYIESPHFYQINRGKRSVCLDLKSDDGMSALHTLLDEADGATFSLIFSLVSLIVSPMFYHRCSHSLSHFSRISHCLPQQSSSPICATDL